MDMRCGYDRHGHALDLRDDYLHSPAKEGKENAAPQGKAEKADGNWPEVEIRVASKHPGDMSSARPATDSRTL